MPYGQIVYNLIDYSGKKVGVNSPIVSNKKLSEIDNLVKEGQKWSKVTIQAPPYSRWLIKQNKNNILDKIIRIGKSGVFEFDQEVGIEYLSYIPTYNHVLDTNETENEYLNSLHGFNELETKRKAEKNSSWQWFEKDIDNDKVKISVVIDDIKKDEEELKNKIWENFKKYHATYPGELQFDKLIDIKWFNDICKSNITGTSMVVKLDNPNLIHLFDNQSNSIKAKYDAYIAYNTNYQENETEGFMIYYHQYLRAKRGIYYSPGVMDGETNEPIIQEIEPTNIIIDYYYE